MLKKKLSLLIFLFFSQGSFAFKFNQNSYIKQASNVEDIYLCWDWNWKKWKQEMLSKWWKR